MPHARPEQTEGDKPYQHHRPKDVTDEVRSVALYEEQTNQDRDGDGSDHRREPGCVDLQTFYSAEYRDCRRNHAIAIEQRCPDQTDYEQGPTPAPRGARLASEQREQRNDAALSVGLRMIRMAYLSATIRMSDQRITDTIPITLSGVGAPPASAACFRP